MRLFIAIRFPDEILNALLAFQQELASCGLRGRWAPPENLHLTLAFIGEYGRPDEVTDAMASVPFAPFSLRLDGMGRFGDLYWAGLAENRALSGYVRGLRHALADRHIPFDRKRFSPHITLVRKAVFLGESALPEATPPTGEAEIRRVSLMRSERGKNGMIYTEIGCCESEPST